MAKNKAPFRFSPVNGQKGSASKPEPTPAQIRESHINSLIGQRMNQNPAYSPFAPAQMDNGKGGMIYAVGMLKRDAMALQLVCAAITAKGHGEPFGFPITDDQKMAMCRQALMTADILIQACSMRTKADIDQERIRVTADIEKYEAQFKPVGPDMHMQVKDEAETPEDAVAKE
jgi:hypothetical protein